MGITYEALYKERELMDEALERGRLVLTLRDAGAMINFRQRCYQARTLDRTRSIEIYPPESDHYGKSRYDSLAFVKTGELELTIEDQGNDLPLGVTEVKE